MDERIATVLAHYFTAQERENISVQPLGSGRINDTYLAQTPTISVVLQRINSSVFIEPAVVAVNFFHISKHLVAQQESTVRYQWAKSIETLDGQLYYCDPLGQIWRGQSYIPSAHMEISGLSLSQVAQLGHTLAVFHLQLSSLDHRLLKNPLPGFHHLPSYESAYKKVVCQVKVQAKDELYCLDLIDSLREDAFVFPETLVQGLLTENVIHGDPKIDNFIFDGEGKVIGLIDLDTVYLNALHVDIGDCLRSLCDLAGEEGRGGVFDLELCGVFLEGYFQMSDKLFSESERRYIYDALLSMTYELGMRFFTDHLAGDVYFRVQKRGDNLNRATSQFLLAEDIVRKEDPIRQMCV